jgi:hypothetical protein
MISSRNAIIQKVFFNHTIFSSKIVMYALFIFESVILSFRERKRTELEPAKPGSIRSLLSFAQALRKYFIEMLIKTKQSNAQNLSLTQLRRNQKVFLEGAVQFRNC